MAHICFVPRTPSFANPSLPQSPGPVTGHSYLLHTLRIFVGKRGLTLIQKVPLHMPHPCDGLSSSVCSVMHHCLIHLFPLAYGARRSHLIGPASRIQSEGRPRHIQCYKMCFKDSGLWCWDASTQAAGDDVPSQRRGWRGV